MSANNLSDRVKVVQMLAPASFAHGAATDLSAAVDTLGFRWAYFIFDVVQGGTAIDSGTTFTVSASATSGGTYVTLEDDTFNMTGGVTANVTAVAGNTLTGADGDSQTILAEVDLSQFDRYLKLSTDANGESASTVGAAVLGAYVILSSTRNGKEDVPGSASLAFQLTTADKAAY